MKLVAAVTIAAVTVMQLVRLGTAPPDQQLADAFEPDDQPVLEACRPNSGRHGPPEEPSSQGSLAFAAWAIARLGGWTGYCGMAGPKVMRRGLDDFRRIKFGTMLRLEDV